MWGLTQSFTVLIRDKEIIAAEVMREYNDGVSVLCSWWRPVLTRLVCISTDKSYSQRCGCHDSSSGDGECLGGLTAGGAGLRRIDCLMIIGLGINWDHE